MTSEQFTFWLKGYLEAEPLSQQAVKTIRKKLNDVVSQKALGWPYVSNPYNMPYTWCTTTPTPKESEGPSEMTITCQGSSE